MSDVPPNPNENNDLVEDSIKSIKEEGITPQELLDRLIHLQEEYFSKYNVSLSIVGSDGKPMPFERILDKINNCIKFMDDFLLVEGEWDKLKSQDNNLIQARIHGVTGRVTRTAGLRSALKETFINKYRQFDNPEIFKRFKVLWKMLYNEDIE